MAMRRDGITKANYIGLSRIFILTPLAIAFVVMMKWNAAFIVVCLSGISDILDGIVARREKTVSSFGVFLDLTADKVFVSATLVCLVYQNLVPLWIVLTILLRDFLVMGLRCFAAAERVVIPANKLGGWKVIITFMALLAITAGAKTGLYLLVAAAALATISGVVYFWRARRLLSKDLRYPAIRV